MAGLVSLIVLLLPLLVGASAPPAPPPAPDEPRCAVYDEDTVRLSGVIELRTFPGAPGYGEDPAHDEREPAWILRLFEPICATGTGEIDKDESAVREIQVVVEPELVHAFASIMGRPVTVTGTLFHSHSGHHHTPVLIIPSDLSGQPSGRHGSAARPALRAAVDVPSLLPSSNPG
jgi:hypothetical protein